ncbi:hypothetical protein [Paenibacillus sedimenti]|nr:hypothetical protein [Paenibacillus sedimenti]
MPMVFPNSPKPRMKGVCAGEVQARSGKHISAQAAGFLLRDAQYMLSKQ